MANESYETLLQSIKEQGNPLQRIFPLGENEKIYKINLDTRAINAPVSIGVQNDHQSDYIFFEIDRYYELTDLTTAIGIITYENANNEQYIYVVPFYDTVSAGANKIIFPWCIQSPATKYNGKVSFAIKFFKINDDNEIVFDLNTLKATTSVLQGWSKDILDYSFSENIVVDQLWKDVIDQMRNYMDGQTFEINWTEASSL